MTFNAFKNSCISKQCKIVKYEIYCPDENHPTHKKGWNERAHKYLNVPRKITKIGQNSIDFEFEGNVSSANVSSAKDFQATEKGFTLGQEIAWDARLTYEWV